MFINALKIWSWKGRVCRWQYFVALLLLSFLGGSIVAMGFPEYVAQLFCFFLLIPSQIKRLHDINWSGWVLLLVLMPVITIAFGMALFAISFLICFILSAIICFVSGTKGPNNYGKPPHQLEEKE